MPARRYTTTQLGDALQVTLARLAGLRATLG